jgi:hypothetical protein
MPRLTVLLALLSLTRCGYHVSGQADLLPKTIKTIAIPPFANNTVRYRLSERLPQAITRELISRTRYQIVHDPNIADAVLRGSVINVLSFPTTFDTTTGRAAGVQINVILQLHLVERASGKQLYTNPGMEIRERYEISTDQLAYFEESDAAMNRLSKSAAAAVVSAILEAF